MKQKLLFPLFLMIFYAFSLHSQELDGKWQLSDAQFIKGDNAIENSIWRSLENQQEYINFSGESFSFPLDNGVKKGYFYTIDSELVFQFNDLDKISETSYTYTIQANQLTIHYIDPYFEEIYIFNKL